MSVKTEYHIEKAEMQTTGRRKDDPTIKLWARVYTAKSEKELKNIIISIKKQGQSSLYRIRKFTEEIIEIS